MSNHQAHPSPSPPPSYFSPATELADLGRERFDHETAQITHRDHALLTSRSNATAAAVATVRPGRAPKGLEGAIHAWTVFQHTTEERDDREERKGDLHAGQLHRQNRAARGEGGGEGEEGMGKGKGKGKGKGRERERERGEGIFEEEGGEGELCAGRKPEWDAPPLAKGFAEELDKDMFWDGPIDA